MRSYTDKVVKSRNVLRLFLFIVATWLPALIGHDAVRCAAALFPLAEAAHPYFVPAHAGTLYLWTPLVVMSSCFLFLSPGLFLSLALDGAKNVGQWVLAALALSLIVISSATGIVQAIMQSPLRGHSFAVLVAGCSVVSFGFLIIRIRQGRSLAWPLAQSYAIFTILSMLVVSWLLLVGLGPKFYWENFNGDGAHTYESARLLLTKPLPFWPAISGDIASYPGLTSMLSVYPASWFIRLFGEIEASVRLPFVLYLVPLYGGILALVEYARTRPVGLSERWLIWFPLVIYTIVMAFSATYNPYFADIALPAAQDTLLMSCLLGYILTFLTQKTKLSILFIVLTFLCEANGALLIGLWLVSVAFLWRPRPWRQVRLSAAALLCCVVVAVIAPHILTAMHYPPPGQEHNALGILKRFAFLQLTDWRRLGFVVLPSGILPALGVLAWRRQDQIARGIAFVTIAYFAVFYIQAHISLHVFVPAMILPLVVYWRLDFVATPRRPLLLLFCNALACVAALLISLPGNPKPHISGRNIGAMIEDRIGGYSLLDPAAFRRSSILTHLFPYAWDPAVPAKSYGGSPLIWYYYAHQTKDGSLVPNYVMQLTASPAPPGMKLIAQEESVSLYVRSDDVWASHRAIRPPTPAGSTLYAIPRGILFRSIPLESGPKIINMVNVLENVGVDMGPILDWLGVKR